LFADEQVSFIGVKKLFSSFRNEGCQNEKEDCATSLSYCKAPHRSFFFALRQHSAGLIKQDNEPFAKRGTAPPAIASQACHRLSLSHIYTQRSSHGVTASEFARIVPKMKKI